MKLNGITANRKKAEVIYLVHQMLSLISNFVVILKLVTHPAATQIVYNVCVSSREFKCVEMLARDIAASFK